MTDKKKPGFPKKEDIQKFILENGDHVGRREIARAFGIKGEDRRLLRQVLNEMCKDGTIDKGRNKTYAPPEALPPTATVEVTGIDADGEILAKPVKWTGKGRPPMIYLKPDKRRWMPEPGHRALVKLTRISKKEYEGRVIHRLGGASGRVTGVYRPAKGGGWIHPTDRNVKHNFFVPANDAGEAQDGEIVVGEIQPEGRGGNRKEARVVEVLGHQNDPRMISLIEIHTKGIPTEFSDDALAEAGKADLPELGKRQDLRSVALVTIDGIDARDFDDAVFAEPDGDPKNKGGWHLIVAIADVSYYVRPGSALDRDAYRRGNSTYFPDRVVPMLPEELSNDLCSLRPDEDRACLAAHMWIDRDGRLLRHKFVRALMRSKARLVYEQVQAARDGVTDEITAPLVDTVIAPLYEVFDILEKARRQRGALDLDLPERKAEIDKDGHITDIVPRERMDSHKLIEEFMILANVAAAEALEAKEAPCVYRVHDSPDPMRLEAARSFLKELGYNMQSGKTVNPKQINGILEQVSGTEVAELVSSIVLRSQSQAAYSPDNLGHFGLALERYAHFTSPIRRYSDLIVHRALVRAYKLGDGGLDQEGMARLGEACEHISDTERRSMSAERDAMDRYTMRYLEEQIGASFEGRINGVTHFGLFVTLDETGADGLIPIRTLPKDFYIHDEAQHALIGRDNGLVFRLGAKITVHLVEADPMRGSMVFELARAESADIPGLVPLRPPGRNSSRAVRRKHNRKGGGGPKGKGGKKGKPRGKKGKGKPRKK